MRDASRVLQFRNGRTRMRPRMAWQYHGYAAKQTRDQNPGFYPWYCHAIRGPISYRESITERQKHLRQKYESSGTLRRSLKGRYFCPLIILPFLRLRLKAALCFIRVLSVAEVFWLLRDKSSRHVKNGFRPKTPSVEHVTRGLTSAARRCHLTTCGV